MKSTIRPQKHFDKPISKKQIQLKQQLNHLNILRYEDFDTIKIIKGKYIETDQAFIQDVTNIANVRQNIIGNIINFTRNQLTDQQCNQIDYRAQLHSDANTINVNSSKDVNLIDPSFRCNCGCSKAKGGRIHFCSPQQDYQILGPGAILLFMFLKFVIFGLFIGVLSYGIYSLTTNLMGDTVDVSSCANDYCAFRARASDQNKIYPQIHQIIQPYLGLGFCVFWIILMRVIKYSGKQTTKRLDRRFKTASDYAIKIQNLPYGQYSQEEMIEYFERIYEKKYELQQEATVKQTQQQSNENQGNLNEGSQNIIPNYDAVSIQTQIVGNPFHIKSIQIVYNMQFSRKMIQQVFYQSLVVQNLLKQDNDNKRNRVDDPYQYRIRKNKLKQSFQLLQDLRKKFLNDGDFRKNISTTCCFIQFMTPKNAELVLNNFGSQKMGVYKQIKNKLKGLFFPDQKNILFKGKVLDVVRAPQPTDILWTNCEKQYSLMRKIVIYTITFFIILVSFGIITGLNYAQQDVALRPTQFDQSTLTAINYIISFSLMIVNNVLWFALFFLLDLQYNHTLTQKIVSQMNKTLFASSINVIVLPIISFYVLPKLNPSPRSKGKYFQTDGIAGQVYDYHVSMATVGLILRFFDPLNLLKRMGIWTRITRNWIIRFKTSKVADVNPQQGVSEINKFYEGDYFDIADLYVTALGAILHAAFFIPLQPAILFIVTGMLFIFYWIYKFKVFYVCKFPQMTDYLVFETALTQAGYVPIIYGAGTIVHSYIVSIQTTRHFDYIPGVICIGLGVIAFFNPADVLNLIVQCFMDKCLKIQQKEQQQANISQTYYQDSNSLTLLGFQTILKGGNAKQLKSQLKAYCQSFFRDYYQDQVKKVGMNFIQKNLVNQMNNNATVVALNMFKPNVQRQKQEKQQDIQKS